MSRRQGAEGAGSSRSAGSEGSADGAGGKEVRESRRSPSNAPSPAPSPQEAAATFLAEFGRALSVLTLYGYEHRQAEAVEASVLDRLKALKAVEPRPALTFLDGEVILNRRPLRDLRSWSWAERLASIGVQRIEFPGAPHLGDLSIFLEELTARLVRKRSLGVEDLAKDDAFRVDELQAGVIGDSIRFGRVGLGAGRLDDTPIAQVVTATLDFSLEEEAEAMRWLQDELRDGRGVHLTEAEAVVRSLTVAARSQEHVLAALLRPRGGSLPGGGGGGHAGRSDTRGDGTSGGGASDWSTTHAMNVSVLAMALAEFMGMDSRAVRAVGTAALLHDLGTLEVPARILTKPDLLTPDERRIVEQHPVAGARLLFEEDASLELAAVVAYEHHVRYDGTGYPRFRFPRPLHPVSHLVHVCATFDTLLHDRPWRPRWSEAEALTHLEKGAGTEFHPEFAGAFVRMIRLERRL